MDVYVSFTLTHQQINLLRKKPGNNVETKQLLKLT